MDGLIYAYNAPRSAGQRAYTLQRLAGLADERNQKLTSRSYHIPTEPTDRPGSSLSDRQQSYESLTENMETLGYAPSTESPGDVWVDSSNGKRTIFEQQEYDMRRQPFELQHGRRYLRGVPYPLPCDLAEIHRQNLRTLLAATVFGRPVCAPRWEIETPRRVLDLCCGSGYWSAMAHDYFSQRGATDVAFTGLDFAPLAPDYRGQGINWNFVQHDLRRLPLPFDNGTFDIVMLKDTSLINPRGPAAQKVFDDIIRIVKPGGTLEIWDSDYLIRALPAGNPPPPSNKAGEQDVAEETGTFAVGPGYAFAAARNKYIQSANAWITEALDQRRFTPNPCAHYAGSLLQEEDLCDVEQRRVAIPLSELSWERKAARNKRISNGHDSPMSVDPRRKPDSPEVGVLTPDQAGLRHVALTTLLQGLESMEVMLKEVSGKGSEEWNAWWASMMSEMLDPNKASLTGECLELGAWWATKVDEEEED